MLCHIWAMELVWIPTVARECTYSATPLVRDTLSLDVPKMGTIGLGELDNRHPLAFEIAFELGELDKRHLLECEPSLSFQGQQSQSLFSQPIQKRIHRTLHVLLAFEPSLSF